VRVVPGVAASLELADDSVDVVVVAGVLCSVPDQREALAEFRRVLRVPASGDQSRSLRRCPTMDNDELGLTMSTFVVRFTIVYRRRNRALA
jgi:ubiquinone/menaquinone biosynthesis C-methylase UbiE